MIKPNDHLSESDILIAVSQNGIHSPWEDHLSECATCQSALERSAAEQLHWKAVREILTTGEIEFDFGSLTRSHLEQVKRESTSKEERSLVSQLLEPPTHPEMLGRVGRYEVERLLGTGGMGVVFKAYDTELHRAVAIKFLAPHLIHSGAARKRFAREARAAAAIVNDHVVPIHNVETEAEHPYIVMQYIGGDSLQDRIDREGPLEVSEILRIGMQIATGLAAAHAQGLTHRDIKPSNIMLDENVSRALLTDFGLARTNDDASLTRSGVHLGTPNYMSPEQVRNEAIDQRSDLFSFGCVLYTLCTGRPPFRAEQAFAVMRRIIDEEPRPIRETNPNIPEWLERIVLRLMLKRVEDRFQSAYEVAELLRECLAHATAPSNHPLPVSLMASSAIGRGGNRYLGWLIAIVGSFGVLFAGVLVILESSKGTITIQSDTDDVPIRVTKSGQFVERFTVSQDGKSIRVAAGEYTIELESQDAGLEIKGDQVLVKRGESSIVTIELAQKNDEIPLETTTPRFGRLWHQPALAGLRLQCPAVESEGRVYVGYTDRILGLDLHDGSVKWEQQVPNGIAGGMIIQDGWLVVGDRAKNVHCFSTRDSSKRWQVELESNLAVQPTIKKAFRSDDYTVILPTEQGPIQCLSLATGESVYRFNQSRRATGPVMGVGGMALVVACGNDNLLHRFICKEGTEQPTSIPTENVVSHQPAVHEEFVHVRTSDGGIAKYDMICESFEWSFSPKQLQRPTTSPAIIVGDAFGRFPHDGIVVFTVGDSIYGVDWRYGTAVWERSLEANLSDPIIANERVWVCTELGHLCALDPKTGATLWNSQASEKPESISSPPVVIKNPRLRGTRIVVVTDSGSITCFEDAEKGAIAENEQSR